MQDLKGIAATAKLGGHPIHPMLIPFPIALLAATFVSDLAFWGTENSFWAEASFWLLAAALVMSVVAAAAGLTDFLGNAHIRAIGDAWRHMIGNVVAVVAAVINFILRWSSGHVESVLPWGLLLSALVVLLLLYSGRKGGALVYHHRVGIHPEGPRS
jgi:uncharacterized membrane protein